MDYDSVNICPAFSGSRSVFIGRPRRRIGVPGDTFSVLGFPRADVRHGADPKRPRGGHGFHRLLPRGAPEQIRVVDVCGGLRARGVPGRTAEISLGRKQIFEYDSSPVIGGRFGLGRRGTFVGVPIADAPERRRFDQNF